jgi:hypothetical protein
MTKSKPRCPTCLSSSPWFTRCQDSSALTPEQKAQHDRVSHRRGCADPFHRRTLNGGHVG